MLKKFTKEQHKVYKILKGGLFYPVSDKSINYVFGERSKYYSGRKMYAGDVVGIFFIDTDNDPICIRYCQQEIECYMEACEYIGEYLGWGYFKQVKEIIFPKI